MTPAQTCTREEKIEQLKSDEDFMRAMLDAASNTAIYVISPEGIIERWNAGATTIFGFTEKEAIGMDFRRFYPKEYLDKDVPDTEIRDASSKGSVNLEGWRLGKGDRAFYAQASLSPIRDSSGKVISLVKVVLDNTQVKQTADGLEVQRKEMKAADEYTRTMLDAAANTAIYVISPEGIIERWNAGATAIFGFSEKEAIGMDFRRFYPQEELDKNVPETEIRDASSKGSVNLEGWRLGKGDRTFYAQASLSPIRDGSGKVIGLVKVVLDNTKAKQTADRLDAQRKEMIKLISNLNGTTADVNSVTTQLSSSTAQATAAIAETTATAEEVKQTANQTSQKAKAVSDDARAVLQVSRQGQDATDATVKGMVRIRQQMESITNCMGQLANQSRLIGDIIATVDDIAQQSNLLAVNASIEAAKAGEQGKGFAVVAQEVKNLSQQSKAATSHVRAILNDIVRATAAATSATEQGSKAVEIGHEQASEAGQVIRTLTESIEKAAQANQVIEVSSQQQVIGMNQMVEAMEAIKIASEQNLASASQLEESGKGLAGLSRLLQAISAE